MIASVFKRPVCPSSPRTGQKPSLRPLDGTDAQLQSILTLGRDGRPGPIDVLVYASFSNFMSIMSVLLRSETVLFWCREAQALLSCIKFCYQLTKENKRVNTAPKGQQWERGQ